jgi:hypothetical protein
MDEPRKVRADLTAEEQEWLERYGALAFKSTQVPDLRVEVFIPSRTQR